MFRILVVDDDKNTRKYIGAVLEENNYTVFTAQDGEEALDIIDREYVDLILLDIMMPKLNGYDFTKELRDAGIDVPVLMVSAMQLPADRHKGFIVGADDYITTPIDETEMLLRVKALLRRAQKNSERVIEIGDVRIDYDKMTVEKQGEVQELPQKEFLILYKLLSYPGKIFTRIQLMEEIWGKESETGLESVTVHIGRLKKRFDGWSEFRIESVRGIGYRAVKQA